jgi:hypothetical protein
MNDDSWMFRNSPKGLYKQDYLQGVKSFINFALSNPKNISVGKIRCSCVPYKMMLERMIGLTSRFSNIIRFMDDNSNPYRCIMIDVLRMNQGYLDKGLYNIPLDEEPNIDAVRFFKLLKDLNELL